MLTPRLILIGMLLVGCEPQAAPSASGMLQVAAVAGPVCPAEQVPPDPACDARPVPNAPVIVQPGDGRNVLVANAFTDEDGNARLSLPAGNYLVSGGEIDGLFGVPSPVQVTVTADGVVTIDLAWDTGIR